MFRSFVFIFSTLFLLTESYTLWIELPSKVAQGDMEDVREFFELLRRVTNNTKVDQVVLRVLDPWASEDSSTHINSWIYNPNPLEWVNNTNPMYDALLEMSSSNVDVFFLPELHVGDYMKYPCYPNSKVSDCSTVDDFLWINENIACSYDSMCQIPYFVSGDTSPYAGCCGSLELKLYNHTLDFSQSACCDSSSSHENKTQICDIEEMNAKGGSLPCVNPLNRIVYLLYQWGVLLGRPLGGIVFDLGTRSHTCTHTHTHTHNH